MDETENLGLPYILPAQAQKHVTHNEAIRALDALVQLAVLDRDLAAPPIGPAGGDRYLVASGASGEWTGHEGDVAIWQDNAWAFHTPKEGWTLWVSDEDAALAYDGTSWVSFGGGGGSGSVNPTPLVGVNATADTTNRLSVSSPSTLFNHVGNGHQQKINKNAVADTASQLYQTGFSGRAEVGLTGDDDFHFKVSPDGSAWKDAIQIDKSTGVVTMPFTSLGGGGGSGGGTNPNFLINGDFQINQRAFAGGALSGVTYGHDRWKAALGGANYSVASSVATLASGELEQVVETDIWRYDSFASNEITISVEAPSQDLTVTFGSQSGLIAAGSGRQAVTLALGAGDTGNLSMKIKRAASGSVDFARVKLEIGNSATPWQARSNPLELYLARRYCQQVFKGNGTSGSSIASFYFQLVAGIVVDGLLAFDPPMRSSPSLTSIGGTPTYQSSNPTSGNKLAFFNNGSGAYAGAGSVSLSFNGASALGSGVRFQSSSFSTASGGVGNVYIGPNVNVLADAEI